MSSEAMLSCGWHAWLLGCVCLQLAVHHIKGR